MSGPADDGAEREAAEIEARGAFASPLAPGAGGGAAETPDQSSDGGVNEQQDARRLHGEAAEGSGAAPDPTRAQDEVGSANSSSSH